MDKGRGSKLEKEVEERGKRWRDPRGKWKMKKMGERRRKESRRARKERRKGSKKEVKSCFSSVLFSV